MHYLRLSATLAVLLSGASTVAAQQPEQPTGGSEAEGLALEQVTVTARRREESLQRVPDAISAFTPTMIEARGIERLPDFMSQVPNLVFRDGSAYRQGTSYLSMRGVGQGQEGWAPVTYVVDGVPITSMDEIYSGSLADVERIEVLRGPQSAIYGAGAIAGAINVVTKAPTNEFEGKGRVAYARGDDRTVEALASGPIVKDRLLFRVSAKYRDFDGLIDSRTNGLPLDFQETREVRGRLLWIPADAFQVDLRATYGEEQNGSTYQSKIPFGADINQIDSSTEPRRGFAGEDQRDNYSLSAKVQWDLPAASLTSVTGYSRIRQNIGSSLCYDDPSDPAVPFIVDGRIGTACLLGAAFGDNALPGEVVDNLFDSLDNFETVTQDLRVASPETERVRWLVGGSTLRRTALQGFDASLIIAPANSLVVAFPGWNGKRDSWWGAYAQLQADATEKLELTFAARYDENTYRNTSYTDRTRSTVAPVFNENGDLIDTQKEDASAFQPKVQASYRITPDLMVYLTWSKGFRAGFFNTANFARPERTENYEGGFKATMLDGRMVLNGSLFQIDYSNQQFSTIIPSPPFRVPVIIPDTDIKGAELEGTVRIASGLTFSAGLGYLDAQVQNGDHSPLSPKLTANAQVDWIQPIFTNLNLHTNLAYTHNDRMYLGNADSYLIPGVDFVNLRVGVEHERWRTTLFARNLTDERQVDFAPFAFGNALAVGQNRPRTYGVEIAVTF